MPKSVAMTAPAISKTGAADGTSFLLCIDSGSWSESSPDPFSPPCAKSSSWFEYALDCHILRSLSSGSVAATLRGPPDLKAELRRPNVDALRVVLQEVICPPRTCDTYVPPPPMQLPSLVPSLKSPPSSVPPVQVDPATASERISPLPQIPAPSLGGTGPRTATSPMSRRGTCTPPALPTGWSFQISRASSSSARVPT